MAAFRPAAVVLGAEISAGALQIVRRWAPDTGLVVVWPEGVSAPSADLRVDPARAQDDLAEAVRRALAIHEARFAPSGTVAAAAAAGAFSFGPSQAAPAARAGWRANLRIGAVVAAFAILLAVAMSLLPNPGSILTPSAPEVHRPASAPVSLGRQSQTPLDFTTLAVGSARASRSAINNQTSNNQRPPGTNPPGGSVAGTHQIRSGTGPGKPGGGGGAPGGSGGGSPGGGGGSPGGGGGGGTSKGSGNGNGWHGTGNSGNGNGGGSSDGNSSGNGNGNGWHGTGNSGQGHGNGGQGD